MDDAVFGRGAQASPNAALTVEQALSAFLAPLLIWLDVALDKRLVRTLAQSIMALLEWRNRAHGLLLSELGAYICDPAHDSCATGVTALANGAKVAWLRSIGCAQH